MNYFFQKDFYELCEGTVYRGTRFSNIMSYSHFVPFTPQQNNGLTFYNLDLYSGKKKVTDDINRFLAPMDFDNLMFQVARGNVHYIIVDEFNAWTCDLYNAIKYAEAPYDRIEIIRPVSWHYVLDCINNLPNTVSLSDKVPQTLAGEVEAYDYFQIKNLLDVRDDKGRLKCLDGIKIEWNLEEFLQDLLSDQYPRNVKILSKWAGATSLLFSD